MAFCANCGAKLGDGARFCQGCGAPLGPNPLEESGVQVTPNTSVKELLEARREGIFSKTWGEFRRLDKGRLFPLRIWWKDKPWHLLWVKWFLFFGVFPLAFNAYYANGSLTLAKVAWAIGIYFALLWSFILRFCLLPEKLSKPLVAKVTLFTAFFMVLLIVLANEAPFVEDLYDYAKDERFWARLLGMTLGVGIVEEIVKLVPVYLFVYRKKLPFKPVTYAFVGCLSGFAFGVSEAIDYSYKYAIHHKEGNLGYGSFVALEFLRLASLPLLHAVFCGISSYFLGLASKHANLGRALIGLGLANAALLHGLYNTFSSMRLGWIFGTLAILLFVVYVRSDSSISQGNLEKAGSGPKKQKETAAVS